MGGAAHAAGSVRKASSRRGRSSLGANRTSPVTAVDGRNCLPSRRLGSADRFAGPRRWFVRAFPCSVGSSCHV
jgi:hypothetical protein